jgi:hypothetical protein
MICIITFLENGDARHHVEALSQTMKQIGIATIERCKEGLQN